MEPEAVREAVLRVVQPVMNDFETMTMARIAETAGVGEDDLRSVFEDRHEVFTALTAALIEKMSTLYDPARLIADLQAIPLDRPIEDRLAACLEAIDADAVRGRDAIVALLAPEEQNQRTTRLLFGGPEVGPALASVIGSGRRLPAETLAEVFQALVRASTGLTHSELVDVFLHGAVD